LGGGLHVLLVSTAFFGSAGVAVAQLDDLDQGGEHGGGGVEDLG
jgi:hypothetical protein